MVDYTQLTKDFIDARLPNATSMTPTLKNVIKVRDWLNNGTFESGTHPRNLADRDWQTPLGRYDMLQRGFGAHPNYTTLEGFYCGGRVLLFLNVLAHLGFEARYMGSWRNAVGAQDEYHSSHASVDVLCKVGGKWKWVAHDPHYNMSFRDKDSNPLSWAEVWRMGRDGDWGQIVATNDYNTPQGSLTLSHFDTTYDIHDIFRTMILGLSNSQPVSTFPPTWDGIIKYNNANPDFDMRNSISNLEYSLLADFPVQTT